jgi:hypothetical protein
MAAHMKTTLDIADALVQEELPPVGRISGPLVHDARVASERTCARDRQWHLRMAREYGMFPRESAGEI